MLRRTGTRTIPLRALGVRIALAVLLALAFFASTRGATAAPRAAEHQELFFGDGGAGPYLLTWSAVIPGTEVVTIDGSRAIAFLDYTLDAGAGKLRFRTPLKAGQVVQVGYQYRPGAAKPNRTTLQFPMSLTVARSGRRSLQMIGAFRQSASSGAPGLLGFSGDAVAAGAQLQGLFLVGPHSAAGPPMVGNRRAGLLEMSAMRFGAEDKQGALQYRASWTQAGAAFAGAPQLQTPPGLRQMELGGTLAASRSLTFTAQSRRTDALTSALKGKEASNESLQLAYRPSENTSLTLTQETASKRNALLAEEETRQDRLQLEQRIGTGTQVRALLERVSLRTGDRSSRRAKSSFGLQTRPWQRMTLTTGAEFTQTAEEGAGRLYTVGTQVQASEKVSVGAEWRRSDTERSGARSDSRLQLALRGPLAVAFSLVDTDSERDGSTFGTAWSLQTGRQRYLKLEGRSTDRDPAAGDGQSEQIVRLEAQPAPSVKLAAGATTRDPGSQPVIQDQEASLELKPLKTVSVSGGLKSSVQGEVTSRITSLGGSIRGGSVIDVSGQLRQRERDGVDTIITRDYRLAFTPARWLRLQGRYTENPEDKNGQVQDQVATSVGAETRIGALTLGGNITTARAAVSVYEKEQSEFRLGVRLSRGSSLYSAYATTDERHATLLHGETVRFGFTHAMSANFHLQLEGEMTRYEEDGLRIASRDETRANLRLGLRF
jgi:hypothetical protein